MLIYASDPVIGVTCSVSEQFTALSAKPGGIIPPEQSFGIVNRISVLVFNECLHSFHFILR
jgi:hypothetical protein